MIPDARKQTSTAGGEINKQNYNYPKKKEASWW
jgi:hypothetical protein